MTSPRPHGGNTARAAASSFVPGEVIVQFSRTATAGQRERVLRVSGASAHRFIGRPADGLVLVSTSHPVDEAIALLTGRPEIEFAEPNWIGRRAATSDDPRYVDGSLWGMYGDSTTPSNAFGSQAGELWERGFTGSSGVVVGVIDEGIDVSHPDLAGNIWVNAADPVDGVDNDGNGYVDDVNGWDFVNNDNSIYDGNAANPGIDAHGTHVAGVIGARGGNGAGVAGLNWHVTIVGAKVIDVSGAVTADATVAAIRYITDLKLRHGLAVAATNNSWSGTGYSQAVHQAIIQAAKQGILFVAAAGDGGFDEVGDDNDAIPRYPSNYATNVAAGSEPAATYDAVIAVTAIASGGALAPFANYGLTTVDIGAPGVDIVSTTPQNGYGSFSGTSMAAPHVTGAVAIYASMNPTTSGAQRRGALLSQGVSMASLAGRTVTGRRLNVGDFIQGSLPGLSITGTSLLERHAGQADAIFTVSLSAASSVPVSVDYKAEDRSAVGGIYAHNAPVAIPSGGVAGPYPAAITVPAGLGTVTSVKVVLRGFQHDYPSDVDVLLVGPHGQTCLLMSDVGGGDAVSDLTLTFSDTGARMDHTTLQSGTYQPSNLSSPDAFPGPAPAGPYGTRLDGFIGSSPEGTWRLFVVDDLTGFSGSIAGGWDLAITATTADYAATSGRLTFAPGTLTRTIAVPVFGDAFFEPGENFAVMLSRPVNATIVLGEGVATIKNDDFTDHPLAAGMTARAVHIRELRTMVTEVRAARLLPRVEFTDPVPMPQVTVIKAVHVSELRAALAEACPGQVYTDPTLTPGVTPLRTAHIMELRAAVLACQ